MTGPDSTSPTAASTRDALPPPLAARATAGSRLLLVDDREEYQALLAALFAPAGVEIDACQSATQGLAKFDSLPVDHYSLVVSDISMPGDTPLDGELGGLRLSRALRNRGYRGPIVLASTGFDNWFGVLAVALLRPFIGADWLIPKRTMRDRARRARTPRFIACRHGLIEMLLAPLVSLVSMALALGRHRQRQPRVAMLGLGLAAMLVGTGCARTLNDLTPTRLRAAAKYYTEEATFALESGKLADAYGLLGEAIRIDDRYAEAYWQRGRLLEAVERHPEAVADFARARYLKARYRGQVPAAVDASRMADAERNLLIPAPSPTSDQLQQERERQSGRHSGDAPWQFFEFGERGRELSPPPTADDSSPDSPSDAPDASATEPRDTSDSGTSPVEASGASDPE